MSADTAACPHCGVVLDPPPSGSRKCPDCRESIVVRTKAGTKLLFTPEGASRYDRERQREVAANKARRHATNLGFDDGQWAAMESELTERFDQTPSAGDVFWSLANQAIQQAMQQPDWHRLKMIYFTMGLHLKDEDKPFLDVRRESMRCSVREHVEQAARFGAGEPQLKVLGCRPDCEVCAPDDERVYAANDLLTEEPPVPHDCDWCACTLIFDEDWWQQHTRSVMQAVENEPQSSTKKKGGLFGFFRRS